MTVGLHQIRGGLAPRWPGARRGEAGGTPTTLAVTFGTLNSATFPGGIDVTGYADDGTYGAFTVSSGVMTATAAPTAGSYTIGNVAVTVEPDLRAVANGTEFHAMGAEMYGKTCLVREGANIVWAPFETSGHFGNRRNLQGMVIRGDGPDRRLQAYDPAIDAFAHFSYIRWNAIRDVIVEDCIIRRTTATGPVIGTTEASGGGVTTGLITVRRNVIIAARPDPYGDFTAGVGSWPGGVTMNWAGLVQGLRVIDNVMVGGNYGARLNVDWFCDFVGNVVDLFYQDGIQIQSMQGPLYLCANLTTRPMSTGLDAGDVHSDGRQAQSGIAPHVVEAEAHDDGASRGLGYAQSYFWDDYTPGFRVKLRDSVAISDTLFDFTISYVNGSRMERIVTAPSSATTMTNRNRLRFGNLGVVGGQNRLVNSLASIDSSVAAGITRIDNIDHNGGTQAALSSYFTDLSFGGAASPRRIQDLFAGIRPTDPSVRPRVVWASGAERSAYTMSGLSAPDLDLSISVISATAATIGITTDVDIDPVFWCLLPAAAATPTAAQIIERRAASGLQFGWVNVAEGATTSQIDLTGLTEGTQYKVAAVQRNGYSLTSAVQSVSFTAQSLPTVVRSLMIEQSEGFYITDSDPFYRAIPQPTPGDGNLVIYRGLGTPTATTVNAATVAAGEVNPAMAAMSAFLDYVTPGVTYHFGVAAKTGASRRELADDAETNFQWSSLEAIVNLLETSAGGPINHLIECWYNSDASWITTFKNRFWPMYFGSTDTGANFTLGTAASHGNVVDHCLWDGQAASSAKGRGIFTRDDTTWHILTPMPFHNAPTTEMENFSANGARLSEPARAVMHALEDDALAQSVRLTVGPSAHIVDFTRPGDFIHPHVAPAYAGDGQIAYMWPHAIALMRAAGMTVPEPELIAIEGPTDGTYADLLFSLPNGGTLTTLAAMRSQTYSGASPQQQAVTGVELTRGASRRPVFKTTETSYPADFRGTVAIQSASETHATHGRVGRVRVTPTNPFSFGNALSYLRGQATAATVNERDFDLYPWMLIEHVPAWHDASALYPCPGINVKPFQADLQVPVPAPAFAARGAYFDGASQYRAVTGVSVPAGAQGLLSKWFRHNDTAFAGDTLFQLRVGSTETLKIAQTTLNRLQLTLANNTGTNTVSFYANAGTTGFVVGQWYHLMIDWSAAAGGARVWVNGVQVATRAFATPNMSGNNITQVGFGSDSTGAGDWLGDIGHLWLSVTQTLDLSIAANREKFALAGQPVNLGGNGELVTGTAPEWYYDGDAQENDWNNKGTAGNVALVGALSASSLAPSY